MSQETRQLRETFNLDGGAADESGAPVIRRVKILGWESKNHRQYLKESVQEADYSEKVINLNHPDGANKQRQVQDRFGWFESIVKDDNGMWGNLHYNPKHPYADTFRWMAENKPSLVGLSHDAIGTGYTKDGVFHVQKVIEVKSVDLVADPATTKGLFESMDLPAMPGMDSSDQEMQDALGKLMLCILKDDCPKAEKREKLTKALELTDDVEEESEEDGMGDMEEGSEDPEAAADGGEGEETDKAEETPGEDEEAGYKDKKEKAVESIQALAIKHPAVKQLMEEKAKLEKQALAQRLCENAKMPAHLLTDVFRTQLAEAKDEAAMKSLIEDRRSVSTIQRPQATGPTIVNKPELKSFAQALKG